MKQILTLALIIAISSTAFSQAPGETYGRTEAPEYTYAYISVEGKLLSKKLKVEVDLGDTPEQIEAGREYSEMLTNKKSYAAVLNFMVESQFELVETLTLTSAYNGDGGTSGIVFIMRKKAKTSGG